MIRLITILILACAYSFANPVPGSAWLMTDGVEVYPSNTVATPAQIEAVAHAAETARTAADDAKESAAALSSRVDLYSTNYVVTSTVYVQSVGAVAYDPSNQTVNVHSFTVTDTNIVIVGTLKQIPLVPPALDWRQTLGSGGAWSGIVSTVTVTDIPAGVTNAASAYLFNLPRPAGGSAYFRIVDNSTGAGGSGLYWVVFGGLYVDGHRGATCVITNVVGVNTNFYRAQGGIVVEPAPLGGF